MIQLKWELTIQLTIHINCYFTITSTEGSIVIVT